jgi:signal transduction histidine kinase
MPFAGRVAPDGSIMNLRTRLLLLLVVPTVVIVGAYALLRVHEERTTRRQEYLRHIEVASNAIRIAVEQAMQAGDLTYAARLFSDLVARQNELVRIRLVDPALRPLLDASLIGPEGVPTGRFRAVLQTGQPERITHPSGGLPVHSQLLPVRAPGGEVQGVLEIAYLSSRVTRELRDVGYAVGLRMAALFALLALLTWIVIEFQVLRPLAVLTRGIRDLTMGRPGPPFRIERRDELGRVGSAFNEMAQRLEAARSERAAETDRVLDLDQRLRRAQALAVAGKLCASLAHEVGTPLHVIAMQVEVLLRQLPPDSPQRGGLELIARQLESISRIIRGLLETVRTRADVQAIDLASTVELLLPLLRHTAKRRGLTLTLTADPPLPRVVADAGQLQQVVLNLVMNAIDATPAGGRVELRVFRPGPPEAGHVAFAVADSGPGIPDDVQQRMFEPFFTTKPAGQGTGLGLAICRDIVKDCGGQIRVHSKEGSGTTFAVYLPEEKSTNEHGTDPGR